MVQPRKQAMQGEGEGKTVNPPNPMLSSFVYHNWKNIIPENWYRNWNRSTDKKINYKPTAFYMVKTIAIEIVRQIYASHM